MKEFLKFIKSSGIYFVGNVLIKAIAFLMLPIYTKYINPTDYGTYDVAIAYITFFCSVLYLDIWSGIMRYMFDFKNDKDKYKPIYTGGSIFLISSAIYMIILLIIGSFINIKYLLYIGLYGFTMNLQNLCSYIARGLGKNYLYVLSGIIGSIVTVALNIILIVYIKMNYRALYISSIFGFLSSSLIIAIGCKIFRLDFYKFWDKKLFRSLVLFSLPLCLNSVAYWFLTSYNKVVISHSLTKADNGLYGVAGKFAVAINLLTSCFQMAWQEIAFSKGMSKDNKTFYSEAINLYIKFLGIGTLGLITCIYFIFPFMVDPQYNEAKNIIPLYLVATIASALSGFIGNIFGAIKKTKGIFVTMVAASIVNVTIIKLLIGNIGLNAANISLLLGFIVNIALRIKMLQKDMTIKIDYKFIAVLLIMFAIIYNAYYHFGMIGNALMIILTILFALYVFKDYIQIFIKKIKGDVR